MPGAYASIEIGLSAEDGGDSASISSTYDAQADDSIYEESTASFDPVEITNSREGSISGDFKAEQGYHGSGGYTGQSSLVTSGASGSLKGSALLAPSSMSAEQKASTSGSSTEADMKVSNKGASAEVSAEMQKGAMTTAMNIRTGSAHASQATSIRVSDPEGTGKARSWSEFPVGLDIPEELQDYFYGQLFVFWYPVEPEDDLKVKAEVDSEVRQGILATSQDAGSDNTAHASQSSCLDINPDGEGYLKASSQNAVPAFEYLGDTYIVPMGKAEFSTGTRFGTLHARIGAESTRKSVNLEAETDTEKKAIILEPIYSMSSWFGYYPTMWDEPAEILAMNGYEVWRYMDSAANRDRFHSMEDYDVALINSHTDPESIVLSTPWSDEYEAYIDAGELRNFYQNPKEGSLVILGGCQSAGNDVEHSEYNPDPKYKPGESPLFNAFAKAGTIAGNQYVLFVDWAKYSMAGGMNDYPECPEGIFDYLLGGYGIKEANDKVVKQWKDNYPDEITFMDDWGYEYPMVQPMVIKGNPDWRL